MVVVWFWVGREARVEDAGCEGDGGGRRDVHVVEQPRELACWRAAGPWGVPSLRNPVARYLCLPD